MRMAIKASTLKSKNIAMTQVEVSGRDELELRLQAREPGRGLRIEKEETAVITESTITLVELIRLDAR
jgi:hypothetical protein